MNDRTFRGAVGVAAIILSAVGFILLYFVKVPEGNNEALLLALGIVLGWGGAVVQSEFGSTSSGRNLAQANADIVKQTTAAPTGPQPVEVTNTPDNPVPTKEPE